MFKRNLITAAILGLMDTASDGDKGGGGGGGDVKVEPAQAREFLATLGHSADGLKTMPDADVLKLHTTVDGAIKKVRETSVTEFKTAETKRQEAEQAARLKAVPEKYDLKLSQDTLLDSKIVDRIAANARAQGLTNEQAQEQVAKLEKETHDLREANVKAWTEAVKTDKDIGGANFEATTANVQRFAQKFAPQDSELGKLLHSSGYGSHPAVVRLMATIGKAMAEDKPIGFGGPGGEKKSAEEVLYGKPSQ